MGTRAIYTFKGFGEEYHVYKHYDGYPTGAAEFLGKAVDASWPLPRYEPDEFAAAFIASNKTHPGGVRIAPSRTAHCGVEFGYTVYPLPKKDQSEWPTLNVGELMIDVVQTSYPWAPEVKSWERLLYRGKLSTFIDTAEELQKAYEGDRLEGPWVLLDD